MRDIISEIENVIVEYYSEDILFTSTDIQDELIDRGVGCVELGTIENVISKVQ